MIEKASEKQSFIRKLCLDQETSDAVKKYVEKKHQVVPDGVERLLDRVYCDLLLVARKQYYMADDLEEDKMVYMAHPRDISATYTVSYAPRDLDTEAWINLCKAFYECRMIRDVYYGPWRLLDYIFNYIVENYAGENTADIYPLAIGCYNPRSNYSYEEKPDGLKLGKEEICYIAGYLWQKGYDIKFIFPELLRHNIIDIDLALNNQKFCRLISQKDVLEAINKIYLSSINKDLF